MYVWHTKLHRLDTVQHNPDSFSLHNVLVPWSSRLLAVISFLLRAWWHARHSLLSVHNKPTVSLYIMHHTKKNLPHHKGPSKWLRFLTPPPGSTYFIREPRAKSHEIQASQNCVVCYVSFCDACMHPTVPMHSLTWWRCFWAGVHQPAPGVAWLCAM